MRDRLADRVEAWVDQLCTAFPDRHVGGPGNRAATDMFVETTHSFGFEVSVTTFDAVDWEHGDVRLQTSGGAYEAFVGPYSMPYDAEAVLAEASSVEQLEDDDIRGKILLLHGELVKDQLMPKNFVFYNPESHKRVIRALEEHEPGAIVAATGKSLSAGALYPFPMIEDADFRIPSVYMRDVDGERLLAHVGEPVSLAFRSKRTTVQGEHVVARRGGDRPGRVVVFGHIDTREGTPGALDNATAVAALLALAELLGDHEHGYTVDLVPLNGEDYYAAPGQMLWVAENEGRMDEIVLGMNADAAGCAGQRTAVSLYGCPEPIAAVVGGAVDARGSFMIGDPWPQSDHSIFVQYGVPAVAVTSENLVELATDYTHTTRDTPELVDPAVVAEIARFYRDVIAGLPPA
jgi:aminopeptidase YwaD